VGSDGNALFWIVTVGSAPDLALDDIGGLGVVSRPEVRDDVSVCLTGAASELPARSCRTCGPAALSRAELTETGTGDCPQRPSADARRSAWAALDSS